MNTNKVTPNQLAQAKKTLSKIKDYDVEANVPEEIRADEAHLTHIMIVRTTPNMKTLEFEHNTKVHKLNNEALAATKEQIRTAEGTMVILHDGKEHSNTAKANTANAKQANEEVIAGKDAEIEELKRKLAEANKNSSNSEFTANAKQASGDTGETEKDDGKVVNLNEGNDGKEGTAATTTEDAKAATGTTENKGEGVANPDAANAGKKSREADKADKVEKK